MAVEVCGDCIRGREVFGVSSDLNSGKKVRVFHFRGRGGVLGKLHFLGGVFWVRLDLDSGNNFNFQWGWGVGFSLQNIRTGVFWRNLIKIFWKPSWLVHHR